VIVLDTNVLSELVRPKPSQTVIDWIDIHDSAELVITALTSAEVRAGVALLPSGRRKHEIGLRMESLLTETFAGYVLAFDIDSTPYYADILATRTRAGRTISAIDAQIAAISRQHQATLATRNIADFTDTGLDLINPWTAA
jgi:predicted nucleic acid-binding protein